MGKRIAGWRNLPDGIIQAIGRHLDAKAWANARRTCKAWSSSVTGDIRLLEIDLERCAHRWMMVMTCVARLFPRLSSIVLLVGHRITPAAFAQRMEALSVTGIKLQELEVRCVYVSKPMIGSWLEDLSGVTHLKQLQVLRLAGGATPSTFFWQELRSLRHLEVLECMPGVYGQVLNALDADMASASSEDLLGGGGGLGDGHMDLVAQLTQLKQLTLKVHPTECTAAGLHSLAASGLMSQLEHLALYDSELPAGCLSGSLQAASRLTGLQLGLSNVDDLAPLGKLPRLKELSLDAAFLPECRELVYAAARGGLPATGPGALTGLCLLDQLISSPLQLAALSQLSSLAELVLVNPLSEHPAATEAEGAHMSVRQEQQHHSLPVDIAALSGIRSLQLLQVDLKAAAPQDDTLPAGPAVQPLQLAVSAPAVQQLAQVWEQLVTLDLSGFGPELLPGEAVAHFSQFKALRHLSILPAEPAAAAEGQPAAANPSCSVALQRKVPWWCLPKRLVTLVLCHFDLTGSGVNGSGSGCEHAAGPCSSSCCYMPPVGRDGPQAATPQQRQSSPAGLSSRLQATVKTHQTPPLQPAQQQGFTVQGRQQPQGDTSTDAWVGGSCCSEAATHTAVSTAAAASSPASAQLAAAPPGPEQCACAARVAAHFSSLQALGLDHCRLPQRFLSCCLAAAMDSLESLSLLGVQGTSQSELAAALPGLSGLTSLRLQPASHPFGGLSQLLPLRHLKKLNVKLRDLRPDDLSVLSWLRSLFCLSLSAPLGDNGQQPPGRQSCVAVGQVLEVVTACLPYCDVELQSEPASMAG